MPLVKMEIEVLLKKVINQTRITKIRTSFQEINDLYQQNETTST